MGFADHISFPTTPEGKAVYGYLVGMHKKDFSKGSEIFTEDAFFNGLLYKVKGRDVLVKGCQDFSDKILLSVRIEAVNQVGNNKFMALYYVKMLGSDEEMPICDLLTMRDGKIDHVDDCFDVNKASQTVKDDAKAMSNA